MLPLAHSPVGSYVRSLRFSRRRHAEKEVVLPGRGPWGRTSEVNSPVLNLDWFRPQPDTSENVFTCASTLRVATFPKTLSPTQSPAFTVWPGEKCRIPTGDHLKRTETRPEAPLGLVVNGPLVSHGR